MKTILTAPDGLVLRDGKPFGEYGTHAGGFLDWPMPQTLVGMLRTSIGQQRDSNFFTGPSKTQNIEDILHLSLSVHVPVEFLDNGRPSPLFPTPTDLFFSDKKNELQITPATYSNLGKDEGCLSPLKEPVISSWNTQEKPSSSSPLWLNAKTFMEYSAEELPETACLTNLGPGKPLTEEIQHNAVGKNGVSDDGKLYRTRNLYLEAKHSVENDTYPTRLGIYLEVNQHKDSDSLPETAYLGGERRTVRFQQTENSVVPDCPSHFKNQRYLKLVLATHGDFGDWAPKWLLQTLEDDWASIPGTNYQVRLKTAVLPRWQAVSGWDYVQRGPKAMKKLVPPGSVYLIECQSPEQSQSIAEAIWSKSMCEEQPARDGYGLCYVARASISTQTLS